MREPLIIHVPRINPHGSCAFLSRAVEWLVPLHGPDVAWTAHMQIRPAKRIEPSPPPPCTKTRASSQLVPWPRECTVDMKLEVGFEETWSIHAFAKESASQDRRIASEIMAGPHHILNSI